MIRAFSTIDVYHIDKTWIIPFGLLCKLSKAYMSAYYTGFLKQM